MSTVLALALTLLFLMPLSAPTVQGADAPIDLVMGEQGGLPWSISSIQPGDRGSETAILSNMGSATAYLRVWISDIEATDHAGDGAALAKYLRFSLVADGLVTTMDLPATIDQFPASPSDRGQLVIGPMTSGSSVTLRWQWEFVETGDQQNDAQGDGLSFSISYMLTDAPPPAVAYKYMAVDILGWQTVVETDSTGVVQHDVDAVDPLGVHHLMISSGTRIIDVEGNVPGRVVLSVVDLDARPAGPAGAVWLGTAYQLRGYHADGAVVELSFSSPCTLIIGVNASTVPAGYLPMGVHTLDGTAWSRLPAGTSELSRWSAGGLVDGTGILTVFAAPVEDASPLHVIDMSIIPEVQKSGWPVTISTTTGRTVTMSVSVANSGNSSGIYSIDLLIDGSVADTVMAVIEPGEVISITMSASGIEDGEHTATVLDRTSRFSSGTSVDWAMILVTNATILSALVTIRRSPLGHHPRRSGGGRVKRDEAGIPPSDLSGQPGIANPQLLESIEEVWEARRTAEEVVGRDVRARPPGRL